MSFDQILADPEFINFLNLHDLVLPKKTTLDAESSLRLGSRKNPNGGSRILKYYDQSAAHNHQEFVRVHWFSKNYPDQYFTPNRQAKPLSEGQKKRNQEEAALRKKQREAEQQENHRIAFEEFASCGKQCKTHPYLERKNISPFYGLKVAEKTISYLDDEQITRFRMKKGELIIPIVNLEKQFLSYQRISDNGTKLMAKSASPKGGVYPIGLWLGNKTRRVYLCEGYATGAALYEAVKDVVLVCFSINNIRHVCELIRNQYPDVEIILCTDFDKSSSDQAGLVQGLLLAQEHMIKFIFPNQLRKGTDWNDLYIEQGLFTVVASIKHQLKQFINLNAIDVSEQYIPLINEKNLALYFPEKVKQLS